MTGPGSFLKRFGRAREGAAAIEFAFVSIPFIALLFAILELGLVFLVQTTLDNATDEASRQIRTGELQTAGGTAATFKAGVCSEMSWLGTACATNLYVDVQTYASFAGQNPTNPVDVNGVFTPTALNWTPGSGQCIVLVRTYYQWTIFTPLLNAALVNLAGNKRLISSSATFRNEPFATGPC
jgi:Flp pilus assembly protein TadG